MVPNKVFHLTVPLQVVSRHHVPCSRPGNVPISASLFAVCRLPSEKPKSRRETDVVRRLKFDAGKGFF
jgi:hypothetical protein